MFHPSVGQSIPSFLTPSLWQHVVKTFEFPPQEARIVSLVLQDRHDKEIATEMGLSRGTLRTYLKRAFDRVGVDGRVGLVLRVLTLCMGREGEVGCPPFV